LKTYQEALKISKSAEYDNRSNVASILNNIGTVYDELGNREEALTTFREALEIHKERLPNNHSSIAGILKYLHLFYSFIK
jgi:tetratricopeptide (TPR) repeat protein